MKRSKARALLLQAALSSPGRQASFVEGPSARDLLQREAAKPMRAAVVQRELAFESLFGEAPQQQSLF